jgi:hypothetical protein
VLDLSFVREADGAPYARRDNKSVSLTVWNRKGWALFRSISIGTPMTSNDYRDFFPPGRSGSSRRLILIRKGQESPPNAIKFLGKQGFRELALYFRDRLNVISGDLTGCISHHHLVFAFGRVRLRSSGAGNLAETNIAAKITFQASKMVKCQIRISWPLVF